MAKYYYKKLRQHRYNILRQFMLPGEARTISKQAISKNYPMHKILRHIKHDRMAIYNAMVKEAEFNKWSKDKFRFELQLVIRNEYKENGWYRSGQPSVHEMVEAYAKKYGVSPRAGRKGKKKLGQVSSNLKRYKGNIAEQKRRWRERHHTRASEH